jgi:hypothetical protein
MNQIPTACVRASGGYWQPYTLLDEVQTGPRDRIR